MSLVKIEGSTLKLRRKRADDTYPVTGKDANGVTVQVRAFYSRATAIQYISLAKDGQVYAQAPREKIAP